MALASVFCGRLLTIAFKLFHPPVVWPSSAAWQKSTQLVWRISVRWFCCAQSYWSTAIATAIQYAPSTYFEQCMYRGGQRKWAPWPQVPVGAHWNFRRRRLTFSQVLPIREKWLRCCRVLQKLLRTQWQAIGFCEYLYFGLVARKGA